METTEPAPTQEKIAAFQRHFKWAKIAHRIAWLNSIFSVLIFLFAIDRFPDSTPLKIITALVYFIGIAGVCVSFWSLVLALKQCNVATASVTWKIMGRDMLAKDPVGLIVLLFIPTVLLGLAPSTLTSEGSAHWFFYGFTVNLMIVALLFLTGHLKGDDREHNQHSKKGIILLIIYVAVNLFKGYEMVRNLFT